MFPSLTQCMVRRCVARGLRRAGGERSCINVSGLCLELVVLRAIMDISARAISLADRPQWAIRYLLGPDWAKWFVDLGQLLDQVGRDMAGEIVPGALDPRLGMHQPPRAAHNNGQDSGDQAR